MRARYYNPLIRRFINSDPARDAWNWFAYAGGNPVSFVDPTGLTKTQAELSTIGNLESLGFNSDGDNFNLELSSGIFSSSLSGLGNTETIVSSLGGSLANNSGITRIGDNLRIYGETSNGRVFYGNQHVRTTSLSGVGKAVTKVSGPVGHIVSATEVGLAIREDGGNFGPNAQVTTGKVIGGAAGGTGGAAIGALIGAPFGGIGAIPGSVIGGFIGGVAGGFGGSYVGGEAVEYLQGN